jgi:Fe-S-cluster containining protein
MLKSLESGFAGASIRLKSSDKQVKLKTAADITACLVSYRHLVVRVDRILGHIRRKYGGHIACHKGCGCGCRNISIFPVEALAIADAMQTLPEAVIAEFQRRAASTSFWECPLLEDRVCRLYAFRPLICRTHGFPLRSIYKGQPSIGYCRHNFKETTAIPDDAIIDLDRINDMLRSINAAAVDELAHILRLPDRLSIAEAIQLKSH